MTAATGSSAPPSWDLTRILLAVVAIGGLIAASFWVLRPFLLATVWATMIVVATWPLLLYAQGWLGGRRSLAVALMTIALLLILVAPLYLSIGTIVENADRIADWSKSLATLSPMRAVIASNGVVSAPPTTSTKFGRVDFGPHSPRNARRNPTEVRMKRSIPRSGKTMITEVSSCAVMSSSPA
jgi:hypothetical protein